MKRLVILTVGKTHSGKTTFAKALEQQLENVVVIDQDNHAEFINTYYKSLRPLQGPNTFKYAITNTIVDYAVRMTNLHIILSNSNRSRKGREQLLAYFHDQGFESVIVHFDLPDSILEERVQMSERSNKIFRTASNFQEVLNRQIEETRQGDTLDPEEGEAEHLFIVKDSMEVQSTVQRIMALTSLLGPL